MSVVAAAGKDEATQALAAFTIGFAADGIPEAARRAAARGILNGAALMRHAADHEAVRLARTWVAGFGAGAAGVVGGSRAHPAHAALVNGIAAHVEDFDDTHEATIIHPTAPVLPAVLAVAEATGATGAEALAAHIIGVDVACRVAEAMFPSHYDRGHHITGTAGALGAAAAVARLLHLDVARCAEAFGVASCCASGLKGAFGSMTKSLHPGKAAHDGVMAAQLAAGGFTSGRTGLDQPLGLCGVLAERRDPSRLTEGLGSRWLIAEVALKPFACGVVAHPAIDGAIRLRAQGVAAGDVAALELRVHPRVRELMGNATPRDALEGKFSAVHAVAAALLDGRAGPRQFTDARVGSDDARALRDRISLHVDDALAIDQAALEARLADGSTRPLHVEAGVGGARNPLSDAALLDKAADLLGSADAARRLREAADGLGGAPDVGALAALVFAAG